MINAPRSEGRQFVVAGFARLSCRVYRHGAGGDDGAGVQPLLHLHDRNAGLGVARPDRVLYRRRATPARQQRGMDVQAAVFRRAPAYRAAGPDHRPRQWQRRRCARQRYARAFVALEGFRREDGDAAPVGRGHPARAKRCTFWPRPWAAAAVCRHRRDLWRGLFSASSTGTAKSVPMEGDLSGVAALRPAVFHLPILRTIMSRLSLRRKSGEQHAVEVVDFMLHAMGEQLSAVSVSCGWPFVIEMMTSFAGWTTSPQWLGIDRQLQPSSVRPPDDFRISHHDYGTTCSGIRSDPGDARTPFSRHAATTCPIRSITSTVQQPGPDWRRLTTCGRTWWPHFLSIQVTYRRLCHGGIRLQHGSGF